MRSSCRATTIAYVVGSVDMQGRGSYSDACANGIAAESECVGPLRGRCHQDARRSATSARGESLAKTAITQAQDRTRNGVTLGGLHRAAERDTTRGTEQSGGGVGVVSWLVRRGGGASVLPQKRCDWAG